MSLTSILSSAHYRELKEKLKEVFPRPNFTLNGEILAEPKTKNYGTVGTAFDYLLRFHLERINSDKTIKRGSWVAGTALRRLEVSATPKDKVEREIQIKGSKKEIKNIIEVFDKLDEEKFKLSERRYNLVKIKFEDATKNYSEFISTGIMSEDLVKSTIFLAKLDVYFRAGVFDDNISEFSEEDVADLKLLISLVPFNNFTATEKCYLNPTFGEGSGLVGGADADIIIDDTLYDFKVTKNLKLEREQLNQIIGYYVLSQIGGINEDKDNKPIKNVGIYYARHGIILKFCIADFNTEDKIQEFIEWFPKYMDKNDPFNLTIEKIEKDMEKKLGIERKTKNNTI